MHSWGRKIAEMRARQGQSYSRDEYIANVSYPSKHRVSRFIPSALPNVIIARLSQPLFSCCIILPMRIFLASLVKLSTLLHEITYFKLPPISFDLEISFSNKNAWFPSREIRDLVRAVMFLPYSTFAPPWKASSYQTGATLFIYPLSYCVDPEGERYRMRVAKVLNPVEKGKRASECRRWKRAGPAPWGSA